MENDTQNTSVADANAQAKAEATALKEKEKAEAKALKEKEKAEAKALKVIQNGVTRPKPETKCGRTWGIFDLLSEANNSPIAIADALPEIEAQGLSVGNAKAEYALWRKFNGISGRIPAKKIELAHGDEIPANATPVVE